MKNGKKEASIKICHNLVLPSESINIHVQPQHKHPKNEMNKLYIIASGSQIGAVKPNINNHIQI